MVHAAMAAYKSGMEKEAQAMIDALTIEYPEHSLILYGQGQLAVLKGEVDAALVAFKASMDERLRIRIPCLSRSVSTTYYKDLRITR